MGDGMDYEARIERREPGHLYSQTVVGGLHTREELEKRGAQLRQFSTGATRDGDEDKNDYEGFLSPLVLEAYGDYMREHQIQSDGSRRTSDNWQKGIPKEAYLKSLLRHVLDLWKLHRGWPVKPEKRGGVLKMPTLRSVLSSIMFNVMGYFHEVLKEDLAKQPAGTVTEPSVSQMPEGPILKKGPGPELSVKRVQASTFGY